MSGRVFISHASQDSEVAVAVCDALEAHGMPCWIAPRDITPGKEYAHALYDAIVECRALLLVLSANAVASGQVRREIEQAARDGDPIIPFRIDDCEPGPALEFHIGRVEWLASPSVELAAQIGALVTIVQAQMAAGAMRPAEDTRTDAHRAWRGYPGVLRRLLATWITVCVVIATGIAASDWIANVVALSFARQQAVADAARPAVQPRAEPVQFPLQSSVADERASPFREEEPVERVTAIAGIQLIVMFPIVFLWLAWLCGAYLTLEHTGTSLRHAAARAPGRFMGRIVTLRSADALHDLWTASTRADHPAMRRDGDRAPRRLRPFTLGIVALLPLTMFTLIVANEDEWSDQTILAIAIAADVLLMTAGVSCLSVLKPIEKRLRSLEADLQGAAPPQHRENAQTL